MQITINGKKAALKKGMSFEYVAENRAFSGSDGYTLSITFPLRGCPENIAIFGHICRADVIAKKVIFDCEIRDAKFSKFGSIVINEINDAEVKTQFLEGRSEQNFDVTFDDIFINELDLGSATGEDSSTPEKAWYPLYHNYKCVALPWVNDYSGNIQNCADYHPEVYDGAGHLVSNDYYSWHTDCKGRSWQPYLLYITKAICDAVGYEYDFSQWESKEEYKFLLICNTLPYAWGISDFARALPHWTVAEYFEKLELFLDGEFTINHRGKRVDFAFTNKVLQSLSPVHLRDIVDEHSVEVTVEDEKCEYEQAKNLVYKECDHALWKYYSCDWFLKSWKNSIVEYDTMKELLAATKGFQLLRSYGRGGLSSKILYAKDNGIYFVCRALRKILVSKGPTDWFPNTYDYVCTLQPINTFGGRIVDDSEDADEIEIEFVPARIDETDETFGKCLFLSFSGYDEDNNGSESTSGYTRDPAERKKEIDATLYQPVTVQSLEAGAKEKKSEYYDRIYIGFWDGAYTPLGKLPHPCVEDVEFNQESWTVTQLHFDLSIKNRGRNTAQTPTINTRQKTTFKFLSRDIPNPRAIFYIKGKRYLCEKITATFTENGMSQLLKGIFYAIED